MKLQYAGIVGEMKIYDNTNKDFKEIGLLFRSCKHSCQSGNISW